MKRILIALALMAGCGSNAPAIEHAELQCLEADYDSLVAKLASGMTDAAGEAVTLTAEEVTCALKGLSAKAAVVAPPVDAGSK